MLHARLRGRFDVARYLIVAAVGAASVRLSPDSLRVIGWEDASRTLRAVVRPGPNATTATRRARGDGGTAETRNRERGTEPAVIPSGAARSAGGGEESHSSGSGTGPSATGESWQSVVRNQSPVAVLRSSGTVRSSECAVAGTDS